MLGRIRDVEQRLRAKERELEEYQASNVAELEGAHLHRQLRDNLARFRELFKSRHVPKMRQVLRKLFGENVLWFERVDGSYRIVEGPRDGTRAEGCCAVYGAQERT